MCLLIGLESPPFFPQKIRGFAIRKACLTYFLEYKPFLPSNLVEVAGMTAAFKK